MRDYLKRSFTMNIYKTPENRAIRSGIKKFEAYRIICALTILIMGLLAIHIYPAHAVLVSIPYTDGNWVAEDADNESGSSHTIVDADTAKINAGGRDQWRSQDHYYALYRDDQFTGDFEVQVKIVDQYETDGGSISDWARAGIMVRNDISGNGSSKGYVSIAVTPGNGYLMVWDSGSGNGFMDSYTATFNSPSSSLPSWLKLQRVGNTFTGYFSTNGTDWTQIGSTTVNTANTTMDVGIYDCSVRQNDKATVEFGEFKYESTEVPTYHAITATAGLNGTLSTQDGGTVATGGSSEVASAIEGEDLTFIVNPDTGYEVQEVLVDSVPVTLTGNTYTFNDIDAVHTISASFVITTNNITASAGANGSITPSGSIAVNYGADQTFTVIPASGYEVDTVLVDGVNSSLTGNQHTFQSVTADHTIEVTFSAITHTITASVSGLGGSISPSESIVNDGANATFTVSADSGYTVNQITVDGTESALDENNQISLTNIQSDHTISVTFTDTPIATTEIPGCSTGNSADFTGGFNETDFDLANISVDSGKLVLQTGAQAIDPESIIIPFEQEVAVTFIFEGAGYVSDFGYVLYEDAVDADGNFKGWSNISTDKRHPIFHNIYDDAETSGCCSGGNGILDAGYGNGSFPTSDETALASYDDGTGLNFAVDGDGQVTAKDMRKVLGTFDAGTELVFFLTADKDWNTSDTSGVFFTKKSWNPDTYSACTPVDEPAGTFNKTYHLDQATTESCGIDKGWLAQAAITRMSDIFGITLSGDYVLEITDGEQYDHVIVGAPDGDPNQWILGWEDLMGGGDADHNDMVFRIERKTGGIAQLQSSEAIVPAAADAYYTAVNFEVYDNMPCSGDTDITYYVSIDNGDNWVEITNWDTIKTSDANKTIYSDVENWTQGTPQYTYRAVRIDFAALGISGRELTWKAKLESEDETCAPEILGVALDGTIATNGSFARSSPVVQTNVLYSGSYETPALSWEDKTLRGHLKATRLYDPADPTQTDAISIWDAGTAVSSKDPNTRNIYYPQITISSVTNEVLATGSGTTTFFTGTLAHYPVSATTLSITDGVETFVDKHTDELEGSFGGSGTINRFTGEYSITFNNPPGNGVTITAEYNHYSTASTLNTFNTANVTKEMLGLDDTYVSPTGYKYDLDNDGEFDEDDADWLVNWVIGYEDGSSVKKEWLLGPVDHSVPAVQTPPGLPKWFFGTDISDSERESFNTFRESLSTRSTMVYVGARDGMIHAFDGGEFRWGDNPDTATITENRGYFKWSNSGDSSSADYGTGEELWAFIPANLMSRLKNNLLEAEDQSYVDASPTLADVYINNDWRTVLLSAEGNGGDSVFCLDVTDPTSPTFLWEFADPDLFRSRSSPAVGQIGRIVVDGSTKWVAFFVSGKTYDTTLYPSIYMIDISDGSVLQRIYLDAVTDGLGGVPSGQPAIVDSDSNGFIDRIYIGTDKGYMYKVNIPDDPDALNYSISNCVLNSDFIDSDGNTVAAGQQYHPIYASPAVVVDNGLTADGEIDYNIKIFFGTGDSPFFDEGIDTDTTVYHFFAYIDESEKGDCINPATLDWFVELPKGHRVFASAFAAAGNIYFGTSTAETEDPCEATQEGADEGLLYAIDISTGQTAKTYETGNIVSTPLVEDQHLYFRTSSGLSSVGSGQYNTAVKLGGTAQTSIRAWKEME